MHLDQFNMVVMTFNILVKVSTGDDFNILAKVSTLFPGM